MRYVNKQLRDRNIIKQTSKLYLQILATLIYIYKYQKQKLENNIRKIYFKFVYCNFY